MADPTVCCRCLLASRLRSSSAIVAAPKRILLFYQFMTTTYYSRLQQTQRLRKQTKADFWVRCDAYILLYCSSSSSNPQATNTARRAPPAGGRQFLPSPVAKCRCFRSVRHRLRPYSDRGSEPLVWPAAGRGQKNCSPPFR